MADFDKCPLNISKNKCIYCHGTATKQNEICTICDTYYYKSCLIRKTGKSVRNGPAISCIDNNDKSEVMSTRNRSKSPMFEHERLQLLTEINLLRRIVKEMEDKNELLEEQVQHVEPPQPTASYAGALKTTFGNPATSINRPSANTAIIIIKPKTHQNVTTAKKDIKKELNPQLKEAQRGFLACY